MLLTRLQNLQHPRHLSLGRRRKPHRTWHGRALIRSASCRSGKRSRCTCLLPRLHRMFSKRIAHLPAATSPHRLLVATSPHRLLAATSPHRLLAATSPHRLLAATSPHRLLAASSPHRLLAATSPHRLLASTSPHRLLASTSPHRLLASTSPHRLPTPCHHGACRWCPRQAALRPSRCHQRRHRPHPHVLHRCMCAYRLPTVAAAARAAVKTLGLASRVSLSPLCVQPASGGGAHTPVSSFSLADERQMQMTTFAEHAWLAAEEENSTTVDVCIQVGSARLGSALPVVNRCGLIVATDFSARSPL
jgi:hypothetical protein